METAGLLKRTRVYLNNVSAPSKDLCQNNSFVSPELHLSQQILLQGLTVLNAIKPFEKKHLATQLLMYSLVARSSAEMSKGQLPTFWSSKVALRLR